VAHPSTWAVPTVIAAYSALARTDTVNTLGSAFTAIQRTPIPSRRMRELTRVDPAGTAQLPHLYGKAPHTSGAREERAGVHMPTTGGCRLFPAPRARPTIAA
jgi:hypothetical protein